MGLLSGLFRRKEQPQASTPGSPYKPLYGGTASGEFISERSAMQVTAVYACVRVIAETIAGLPLHLYEMDQDGSSAKKATDRTLYFLLHDEPNPEMTSFNFRETMMTHLLLWGNAYIQIIRNNRGEVVSLYPLMAKHMRVDRDENNQIVYEYWVGPDELPVKDRQYVLLRPVQDVLHIPGLGYDGLVGYSPIAMAKNAIGLSLAAEKYGASFFKNGATPSGVLEHPGVIKEPEKLRESWMNAYGGSANAGRVAILEEGVRPDGRH